MAEAAIGLEFALGGQKQLTSLITSLETSKSNLQLLLEAFNFTILEKSHKNLEFILFP